MTRNHWQKSAIRFSRQTTAKSSQVIAKVPHRSSTGRFPRAKAAKTEREIEKQIRHTRKQIENENASHVGEIGERNQRDLGEQSQRNVKPRPGDPGFGRVQ